MNAIIVLSILISIFVTIINLYYVFIGIDDNKIKLFKLYRATKFQIYKMLVLPSSFKAIITVLKVNVSMSLIGVIMGEFLVSKAGIGYLIMYGSQVFNLDLVITGIIILGILSIILYAVIVYIENSVTKKLSHNKR